VSGNGPLKDPENTTRGQLLRPPRKTTGRIVSANGSLEARPEVEENYAKVIDLFESMKAGKILTGTIDGVERLPNGNPYAIVMYGDIRVILPASQVIEVPDGDDKSEPPYYKSHSYLSKRIGSVIDFIVRDINQENLLATASRKTAMQKKRREFFMTHDRNGRFIDEVGKIVEARVVAANQKSLILEVHGVETFVPAEEVSYRRLFDVSTEFNAGQMVLVKLLNIEKGENDIQLSVSLKQAEENPFTAASRLYNVGGKYSAKVTGVTPAGIFVELRGGVSCLCKFVGRGERPIRGSRVTVVITQKDYLKSRLSGLISHVSTAINM
jgi:ribosomal protein S1